MNQNNYLRKNLPGPLPSWRDDKEIDPEIVKVLEALYFYISNAKISIEEETEYCDIIRDVLDCKRFSEIAILDIEDYLEQAQVVYNQYKNKLEF